MLEALTLPAPLVSRDGEVSLRRATLEDLGDLMALLADDPISAGRGDVAAPGDEAAYADGLAATLANSSNEIVVVEHGTLMGTMQLTLIPGMARRGSTRLLVEAVRVASSARNAGIGAAMMRWTTDVAAPTLGASLVQLTSDSARADAHRFYLGLGFVDSHVGFKYAVGGDQK